MLERLRIYRRLSKLDATINLLKQQIVRCLQDISEQKRLVVELTEKIGRLEKDVAPIIEANKLMMERLKRPQHLRDKELYLKEQEKARKDQFPIQSQDMFKR